MAELSANSAALQGCKEQLAAEFQRASAAEAKVKEVAAETIHLTSDREALAGTPLGMMAPMLVIVLVQGCRPGNFILNPCFPSRPSDSVQCRRARARNRQGCFAGVGDEEARRGNVDCLVSRI